MYLKNIKIKNFRKLLDTECCFNPGLNLIVGANDSGKTAIIDAIRFVLKQIVDDYTRININDFFNSTSEINIDMVFSFDNCTDDNEKATQCAHFAEYITFNDTGDPELRIWFSVKNDENNLRFPVFRVGTSRELAVEMDAKCRDKLRVVYLRPLRDAETELRAKPGSRISKILSKHDQITTNKKDLIVILEKFKIDTENFFKDKDKGKYIVNNINDLLLTFDDQQDKKTISIGPIELAIGTDPKTEDKNLIKMLEKLCIYYETIPNPGLGTLNMIFIATELLHLDMQQIPKLILIEEVEAHLHPQRQLKIIKALQEESATKSIQLILSTHSPNLSSIVNVENLSICVDGNYYSFAKDLTKLSAKNYKYLSRFLDVTKANMFFARGVMLVEGITEQLLVPMFAKLLDKDFTDNSVTIISTNNLGFENFVNIYKRVKPPFNPIAVAVVTDADKRNAQKISEYTTSIQDNDNKIGCFMGEQLYEDSELDGKNSSTLEKIIFDKTTFLKKLYLESMGVDNTISFDGFYTKIKDKKALIAQNVAAKLSEISSADKKVVSNEIRTGLKYISDAIDYLIPENKPENVSVLDEILTETPAPEGGGNTLHV